MRREKAGSFRVFALAAAALALLSGVSVSAANRDHFRWKLMPPKWTNVDAFGRDGSKMGQYLIDEVQANSTGGFVRITILGKENCTGRKQRITYSWRFDRDISFIQGNRNDAVFSVTLAIEGDVDSCINANPFWSNGPVGDLFYGKPQPDRFYFHPKPGEYRGPWTVHVYLPINDKPEWGWRVHIDDNGVGWWTTINLNVLYLFQPVDDSEGPGPGGGGGDKRSRCEAYARQAVDQNKQNEARRCGFTGPPWHNNYDAHFNWCMGVDPGAADSETQNRREALQRCKGKWPGLGGATELGGLDLDAFCRSKGAAGVRLDGQTWKCVFPDGSERVINLDNACRKQYDAPTAVAVQERPGDPQSWTCVIPGK